MYVYAHREKNLKKKTGRKLRNVGSQGSLVHLVGVALSRIQEGGVVDPGPPRVLTGLSRIVMPHNLGQVVLPTYTVGYPCWTASRRS